jgi:hypothetical protein
MKYGVFFLQALFNVSTVQSVLYAEPSTVNIRPEHGVTVTSWSISLHTDESPEWLSHTFINANVSICNIQFIGMCAPPNLPPPESPYLPPIPYHSERYYGDAFLDVPHLDIHENCLYRSVTENWRRFKRHYLLTFWCPIQSERTCRRLDYSHPQDAYITTYYDDSNRELYWNNSITIIPTPKRRHHMRSRGSLRSTGHSKLPTNGDAHTSSILLDNSRESYDVAICAVKPYVGASRTLSRLHDALAREWMEHHKVCLQVNPRTHNTTNSYL